jgi:hypothetical protein
MRTVPPIKRTSTHRPGWSVSCRVWSAPGGKKKLHVAGLVGAAMCSAIADITRGARERASMQGKPKQVRAYETTPEPSTRGVVNIT